MNTLIGHCRLHTKGDPKENKNNHPFELGDLILFHQGNLFNDDELIKKYDLDKSIQTDSYVLLQMINRYKVLGMSTLEAISYMYKETRGNWACALVDKTEPDNIYLFSHNNPISVVYLLDDNMFAFSTEVEALSKTMLSEVKIHFQYMREIVKKRFCAYKVETEECMILSNEGAMVYTLPEPPSLYKWDKRSSNKLIEVGESSL